MKNSKIMIFLSFLIMFFMISFPYIDNVNASYSYYKYNFQNTVGNTPITYAQSSLFDSKKYTGIFNATDVFGRGSGSLKSFYCGASTGKGWWNLTYSKSSYINNFSYFDYGGASRLLWLFFYNQTNQGNKMHPSNVSRKNSIVTLSVGTHGSSFFYFKSDYSHTVVQSYTTFTWQNFGFEILNDLGDMRYYLGVTSVLGSCCNPSAISNGWRIDRCIMIVNGTTHSYMDDLNITFSSSYSEGGVFGCDVDLTGYDKRGIDNTPYSMDLNYHTFQKIHYTLSYGYLKAISLCVLPSMYDSDNNLNNYTATVIGFNLGGADCFYLDGYNYRLVWECNIDLGKRIEGIPSGRYIDVLFTHNKLMYGSTYWQVCVGGVGSDLDSDGQIFFKLWNSARTRIDRDVGVSFYFDPTTQYQYTDSTFPDRLGLHNFILKNVTGFIYDVNQPEGIVCSYLLSENSKAYNCRINVLKNGSFYKNFTSLNFPSGIIGLYPNTIGRYTFKLYNYHYIYNITAYVTGNPSNYFISSDPIITNPYETYRIVYRYYNPTGITGSIGVFDNVDYRNSFVYAKTTYGIGNNLSSFVTYPSLSLKNEYLTLFANLSYKTALAYGIHYIRDTNIMENNIYVSPAQIKIGETSLIKGTHVFPACDISIFVDGRYHTSVKDMQTFNISYSPTFEGRLNISLRLKQNETYITLKYCYLDVSGSTGEEGGDYSLGIEPPYSYFAGVFIVIVFTLSPLLVVGFVKHDFNLSTIPQFLYLVMSCVGFVVSILLGFFPAWSVIVIVVLGALLIAIMYLQKKQSYTG